MAEKKTTEKEVDIIVENVNRPPTIKKITDSAVTEHDTVTILPKIEDPDGDDLLTSFSTPFDEQGIWKTSGGDAGEYSTFCRGRGTTFLHTGTTGFKGRLAGKQHD